MLLELINKFSKIEGHKINIQKTRAFLNINNDLAEKEENHSIHNSNKK
jgi:hypothetical protein